MRQAIGFCLITPLLSHRTFQPPRPSVLSSAPHLSLEASCSQPLSPGKTGAGNLPKDLFTFFGVYSFSFFLGLWKPQDCGPQSTGLFILVSHCGTAFLGRSCVLVSSRTLCPTVTEGCLPLQIAAPNLWKL